MGRSCRYTSTGARPGAAATSSITRRRCPPCQYQQGMVSYTYTHTAWHRAGSAFGTAPALERQQIAAAANAAANRSGGRPVARDRAWLQKRNGLVSRGADFLQAANRHLVRQAVAMHRERGGSDPAAKDARAILVDAGIDFEDGAKAKKREACQFVSGLQ